MFVVSYPVGLLSAHHINSGVPRGDLVRFHVRNSADLLNHDDTPAILP